MQSESEWIKPERWCCFSVCALLLARFLPQLLAVICMHSGRRFVLQRRIWPKYNFKGEAPPSESSAGRIFAEREAFISACCVTLGSAFLEGFHSFLQEPDVCLCLYLPQTGAGERLLHVKYSEQE